TSSTTPMLRMVSSSFWMRTSLSLPCCASSLRRESILRRASSSSKRPARAGRPAATAAKRAPAHASRRAAALPAIVTLVLDVRAAVLRPCGFVVSHRHRLLFAIADRLDAAVGHAQDGHHFLHGFGTALAQREVVFAAAALVAVALDADPLVPVV